MLSEACVRSEKGQLLDFNGNSMKNIFEWDVVVLLSDNQECT